MQSDNPEDRNYVDGPFSDKLSYIEAIQEIERDLRNYETIHFPPEPKGESIRYKIGVFALYGATVIGMTMSSAYGHVTTYQEFRQMLKRTGD